MKRFNDAEQRFFERVLKTICTNHRRLDGRVCELPNGHPGECVFAPLARKFEAQ